NLEHNRDVFFALSRPQCDFEGCPFGSRIISPVEVRRIGDTTEIATIGRAWTQNELLLSARLRKLFERNEISGLQYEACSSARELFLARIDGKGFQRAKDIDYRGYLCEKHSVVFNPFVFGQETPRGALERKDFITLEKVVVRRKSYFFHVSQWVI